MARVIEKHVTHWQQQVTSTMIPYLSIQMMLQSLLTRGQQGWRDSYCLHVSLLTAVTQILCRKHWVHHLHVCPSSIVLFWIEASWSKALVKYVQLCTRHMRKCSLVLNQGRPEQSIFQIHTIIHKTYEKMLIQNSRTCSGNTNFVSQTLSASLACLSIIHSLILNQGRPEQSTFQIRTIIHKTYEKMLIQNSRTCTPPKLQKKSNTNPQHQQPPWAEQNQQWQWRLSNNQAIIATWQQ